MLYRRVYRHLTGKGLEKGSRELEKYGAFSVPKDGENGMIRLEWLRNVYPRSLGHARTGAASAEQVTSYGLTAVKNKREVWLSTAQTNWPGKTQQKLPLTILLMSCRQNSAVRRIRASF